MPKVLVTSIYGHDDMLDYLSDYRTQDKLRGVHYYPKGILCWFETNQYGDPTGSVYLIKRIPDMRLLDLPRNQRGYRRLLKQQKTNKSIKYSLTKEKADNEFMADIKPILPQKKG